MRAIIPFICFLFILSSCQTQAQSDPKLVEMGTLPSVVNESSGMAVASETTFWTHNDRGGKAEFYEVDIYGELKRTIKMIGVSPVDMEDMTQDGLGNLYFADTGNNKQDRDKLKIYIVNVANIHNSQVKPEVIEFDLENDGLKDKCQYDIEAIVASHGKIYMFTKDRCKTPDNSLIMYSVPAEKGSFTAKNEGEFFWEDPDRSIQVTSADISLDGKNLILLSHDRIHFFFAFNKDKFFDGAYNYLPIEDSQKEAVVHMNDCDIYITEEASKDKPAHIWKLNVCKLKFN